MTVFGVCGAHQIYVIGLDGLRTLVVRVKLDFGDDGWALFSDHHEKLNFQVWRSHVLRKAVLSMWKGSRVLLS